MQKSGNGKIQVTWCTNCLWLWLQQGWNDALAAIFQPICMPYCKLLFPHYTAMLHIANVSGTMTSHAKQW